MTQIQIKGTIIPDDDKWFYKMLDMTATAPKDVILPETNEDVEVIINSGGGDVYAGSEIYTALKSYSGHVTVKIVGIAASAASVIAMAGDVVEISPTAQIMIHNVSSVVAGDHNTMKQEAGVLENYNTSIANAYANKTGIEMEELLEMMNTTTWMNSSQAVEKGFADKEMFSSEVPQLVAGVENIIPSDAIAKLANVLNTKPVNIEVDYDKLSEMVVEKLSNKEQAPKGFGAFIF